MNNKKLSLLLCLVVVIVCLLGAAACEVNAHEHAYVEHKAVAATCTEDGNQLYYTCEGCDKIFDADKKEIAAVPTVKAAGHTYTEHAAVLATCTTDGNELYYTCDVCNKIFDKNKAEIEAVPTVAKGEHGYREIPAKDATCTEDGNELYYVCDGCNGYFDKNKNSITEAPVIPAKNHALRKVDAQSPTCEESGNAEYYTCDNGCGTLFDADKKEIAEVPTVAAKGHAYHAHDRVEATCVVDGSEAYFTCDNGCGKLFDADKNVIEQVVAIPATGHTYAWNEDSDKHTAELKCAKEGCNYSKGTINTELSDFDRMLVDYDSTGEMRFDLTKFGMGLSAVNVSYDNKTIVFESAQADTMTVGIQQLFAHSVKMGKVSVTISVKMDEGPTIYVDAPITLAKLINKVDDLIAIRPVVSDGNATVTGGTVTEVDGHKVVTRYYYVLTADLDGDEDEMGVKPVFGGASLADEGATSGNAKSGFVGIFDGNGHTIRNFTLNVRGFFGHVGGGTIANVNFSDIVLNNADSAVLSKLMDATVSNVTIANIETAAQLSHTAGIVAYHEIFGSTIDMLTVDLRNALAEGHVLARQLTDGTGEWKANKFSNIVVKAPYNFGLDLTANAALTDEIEGVSVKFNPFTVAKPAADETEFYYTGHEITYNIADSALYTVAGNKQTDVGTYTVTVSLKPYEGLTWADGTTDNVTFTFVIAELTDDKAQEFADKFAEKVTSLGGSLQLPRDKIAVDDLFADYETLHDKVKALLTETKTTLDQMKAQADKYTQAEVVINDKLVTKISGYDQVVLVIYNPTDEEKTIRIDESVTWRTVATVKIAAKSYGQVELPVKYAAQGNNYTYVNGTSTNITADGWICLVYVARDEAKAQELLAAFNAAVEAIGDPLTADDADKIVAARTAYNALTPYALTLVDQAKVDKLVSAEAAIGTLVDQAAAKTVADMIDALTNDSPAEDVVAASNAYDKLTEAQKAYITEAQLAALNAQVKRVEEAVVQAKADAFKAKVEALGTPTFPKDKHAVEALATEYNALEETVQAKLTETKAKLDGYVEKASKYVQLEVTFGSDRIVSKFSGYDSYYLVIYNPKDTAVSFYYAGEASSWAACGQTTLPSKSYTQIAYDSRFAAAGNAYMYSDGGATINFNDTESGWICKVYGRKTEAGAEVVALSVNGTTDDPTYGKVLSTNVTNGFFEAWGYMKKTQLAELAKFDNVYFYIYNPSEVDVAFFFQDDGNWSAFDRTILKAGTWTKVSLSAVFGIPEGAKGVYVDVEKGTEGITLDGWMISDFYGTAK